MPRSTNKKTTKERDQTRHKTGEGQRDAQLLSPTQTQKTPQQKTTKQKNNTYHVFAHFNQFFNQHITVQQQKSISQITFKNETL